MKKIFLVLLSIFILTFFGYIIIGRYYSYLLSRKLAAALIAPEVSSDIFDASNYPPPDAQNINVQYVDFFGNGNKEKVLSFTTGYNFKEKTPADTTSGSSMRECLILLSQQSQKWRVDLAGCSVQLTGFQDSTRVLKKPPSWIHEENYTSDNTASTPRRSFEDRLVVNFGNDSREELLVRSVDLTVGVHYSIIAFANGKFHSINAPNLDLALLLRTDNDERVILLTDVFPTRNGVVEQYSIFCSKVADLHQDQKLYDKPCRQFNFVVTYNHGILERQ